MNNINTMSSGNVDNNTNLNKKVAFNIISILMLVDQESQLNIKIKLNYNNLEKNFLIEIWYC